jgi:hypothetical protein
MPNRREGNWFVITPVNPKTKLPVTDQARCSKLISAVCTQLEEFGHLKPRKEKQWMGKGVEE